MQHDEVLPIAFQEMTMTGGVSILQQIIIAVRIAPRTEAYCRGAMDATEPSDVGPEPFSVVRC